MITLSTYQNVTATSDAIEIVVPAGVKRLVGIDFAACAGGTAAGSASCTISRSSDPFGTEEHPPGIVAGIYHFLPGALTSPSMMNKFVGPIDVPVRSGERLYFHIGASANNSMYALVTLFFK